MITQDYVKKFYIYEPDTGNFIWAVHRHGSKGVGSVAGKTDSHGYIQIRLNGKSHLAHRIAFIYMTGLAPHDKEIDHVDGVRNNNSWSNLRACNRRQNQQNKIFISDSATGIRGVFKRKNKNAYDVVVSVGGKNRYFGRFPDLEFAELVAIEARNKYHGLFARHA